MQGFWTGWAEYILEVSFIVDLSLPVGFDDWSRTLLKRGGSARLRVLALFEVFYVSIDKLEPTVSFNFYLGGKWSPSKVISSLFCPLLKLQLPPIHPSRPIDFEKSLLRLYNQSTTPSTNSDNYKLSPQSISGALIWIIYISCEKKKKDPGISTHSFRFVSGSCISPIPLCLDDAHTRSRRLLHAKKFESRVGIVEKSGPVVCVTFFCVVEF